jgi:RimJ/RimL family protein N-acetyltransferase
MGFVQELVLRDAARLLVRPLEPTDRAALAEAVSRLSETTRYLRFAAPKPRLTKTDLDALLDLDHHDREALLAIDPLTGDGVAVARYVRLRDEPGAAEVAVTVADEWQGRGLGTALTALLIERARAEGVVRLRAVTLDENHRARRMLSTGGFHAYERDGALVSFDRAL